jgi:hypothetical protein
MPASEVVIALDRLRDIPLAVVSTKELIRDAVRSPRRVGLSAYARLLRRVGGGKRRRARNRRPQLAAATNRAELILD